MAVFIKQLRKHIFVHPGDKLEAAIKNALLKDRRKYLDSLDGALLDVHKIRVVGDRHLVVHGYRSMEVVADFELFSPSIGTELEGVINKKNGANYGCVVKGLFNAYLHGSDQSMLTAKEGDNCTFTVTKVIVSGDILFMNGRLKSVIPLVGPHDIKNDVDVNISTDETHLLNNALEVDNVILEQEEKFKTENEESPKKKKKKKSKRREVDESLDESNHSVLNDSTQVNPHDTSETTCVNINGVKSEPMDNIKEEHNVNSETKSKKKHKKKSISENDISVSNEIERLVSVKSEPGLSGDAEISENKLKKKHKRRLDDGGDFNNSVNNETLISTPSSGKKKRKRKLTDEGEVSNELEQPKERKPVIGVDVPKFSPSKLVTSIKQEKLTPQKPAKIKSEIISPPRKKFKKEKL